MLLNSREIRSQHPYVIEILAADLTAAQSLGHRLEALPEVRQALTLVSFIPDEQAAKLDILDQLRMLMGPLLDRLDQRKPPTAAEELAAAKQFAAHLTIFSAGPDGGELGKAGADFAQALDAWLSKATPPDVAALRAALLGGFEDRLDGLRKSLNAEPISVGTMPAAIKDEWIAKDGRALISVFPKGDMHDNRQFAHFVAAVSAIAPQATGAPVAILESGAVVSHAFVFSSCFAFAAITVILIFILRRFRDVILVLAPLLLATLYTLGTAVAIGMAFNYVNVIAIPLLLGVGVAFNIYFVVAWRRSQGPVALLQTSTARAVFFQRLHNFHSLCQPGAFASSRHGDMRRTAHFVAALHPAGDGHHSACLDDPLGPR